ncbi:MAG: hypothetical protein WAV93_04835 [Bacteroidales bacterium]
MKKSISLGVYLVFMLTAACAQEKALKPYGIKSGIIEYAYSGDKTGTGTLYFDDYGMKSAIYMKTLSEGEESTSWVLTSGNYQYMWDPDQPADGMKMRNPLLTWITESSRDTLESYTEEMYTKMGMVKSGKETLLGKECDVIKGDMGKVLVWNGIMMLMDFKMGAYPSKQEATSVKTNVAPDAKYFVIPQNIKFTEMNLY